MNHNPMKYVLGFLTGFFGLPLILSLFPNHLFHHAPGSLTELSSYYAYDPMNRDKDKYLIVSNCNLINPVVGNDRAHGNEEVNHPVGFYSEVANFYLNRLGMTHSRFFDFGHGGSTFSEHLIFVYHALHLENAKAVILSNAFYPLLFMGRPGEILETIGVLERIENEFPNTRSDAKVLIDYYKGTRQYRSEIEEFGEDWRDHVEPSTFALSKGYYFKDFFFNHTVLASLRHPLQNELWKPSRLRAYWRAFKDDELINFYIRWFFRPGLSAERWVLDGFSNNSRDEEVAWDNLLEQKLNWAATQYNVPGANSPIAGLYQLKSLEQLDDPEGPVRIAFFRLIAKMAASKSVPFIYYLPPRLDMEDDYYFKHYKPRVLKRMQELAAQEKFLLLDQTNGHDLTPLDFLTTLGGHVNVAPALVNIIGNFKRVRLLLGALRDLNLISLPLGATESKVWPAWTSLYQGPVLRYIENKGQYSDTLALPEASIR